MGYRKNIYIPLYSLILGTTSQWEHLKRNTKNLSFFAEFRSVSNISSQGNCRRKPWKQVMAGTIPISRSGCGMYHSSEKKRGSGNKTSGQYGLEIWLDHVEKIRYKI